MGQYLFAMGSILLLLIGWITVQRLARLFAVLHPEFGPAREEGGCGSSCSCSGGGSCRRESDDGAG